MKRGLPWALVLLAAGCAHYTPNRSTDGWLRVRSPHFVLETDLDRGDALEASDTLERTRAALLATAWPKAELPQDERTQVTVLRDGFELHRLFGTHQDGFSFKGNDSRIVLWGAPERWQGHQVGSVSGSPFVSESAQTTRPSSSSTKP